MPNRILREGILSSHRVNKIAVDPTAEVLYRRLYSIVDDFGRFSADLSLIRSACYPLMLDSAKEGSIQKRLLKCVDAGLVRLYSVQGKSYLELIDFNQKLRIKRSKYPSPQEENECSTHALHVSNVCAPEVEYEEEKNIRASSDALRESWFDQFWSKYRQIRAVGKKRASDAFRRAVKTESEFGEVMTGLERQERDLLNCDIKFRPHASTWLSGARWRDEQGAEVPAVQQSQTGQVSGDLPYWVDEYAKERGS